MPFLLSLGSHCLLVVIDVFFEAPHSNEDKLHNAEANERQSEVYREENESSGCQEELYDLSVCVRHLLSVGIRSDCDAAY